MDIDKYPKNLKPGTPIGNVTEEVAKKTGLKAGTPIFIGSGDQACGAAGVGNSGAPGLGSVCLGTAGLCIGYSATPVRDPNGKCHVLGHRRAATPWRATPRPRPLPSAGCATPSASSK